MSFVKNDNQQLTLLDSTFNLTEQEKRMLEKSWAKTFADKFFQPFGVVWHTIGILYSVKHYADWNCQAGKRDCCHQRRTGAYEEMYNNLYELIISDIMMPKIDDYIVKPIELDELLLRVRALLRCWESR